MTRPTYFLWATFVLLGSGSARLAGQNENRREPEPERPADATTAGVYLHDSLEAADELARARRLADARKWSQAAAILNDVAGRFAANLVSLERGLYVNVAEYVNRRIADWPEAGREAYRALCEPTAKADADAAIAERDVPRLIEVTDRYFCTTHAVRTADTAAQLAIEAGQLELAADLYEKLLRRHPDRDAWQNDVKAKLALCYAWAGQGERAERLAAEIMEAASGFTVSWGGRTAPVGEAIRAEIRAPEQPATRPADDPGDFVWPVFGGDRTRSRIVASQARPGAPLWRAAGTGPAATPGSASSGTLTRALHSGRYLATQVAVGHGMIYFHDALTVRAVWTSNGRPAWPTHHAPGLTETGRTFTRDSRPPPMYTTTLAGDRLFVCLGGGPRVGRRQRSAGQSVLECLDARTGEPVWRVGREQLGSAFEKTYFDGAPLHHDGKLYVVARRRRSLKFEDCYLIQLDADRGKVGWRTHLASGSTGDFGSTRATRAEPAIAGQAIFVCTNLGVAASVSLHNGRVQWARLYSDPREETGRLFEPSYTPANQPWEYDPVMVWGDYVVCKPLDTGRLLVFDQTDGTIVKDLTLDRLYDLDYCLGIQGDRLYGVGRKMVFCWDLVEDKEVWARATTSAAYGRGCLTTTGLFVPTAESLYHFPLDGSASDEREWDGKTEGGNILVTPTQVLVAGNNHLSAYARKGDALARLDRRIKAAPDDPGPRLDLAELAFRIEEYEAGLTALDAAAKRAGGYAQVADDDVQRRLFRNCLHFAEVLLTVKPPRGDAAQVLYRKAGQCAPDTAGHVLFRWKLAEFHVASGEYVEAVARWQQILTDRSLREVAVTGEDGKEITAGEMAESRIAGLIRQHGREVYARFEDQARALLAAGRDGGQMDLLRRVGEVYPNSRSAPPALIAQGELARKSSTPLDAARLFRRALTRYREEINAPEVMRTLSDCYRQAGKRVTAAAWLAKAAREFPKYAVRLGTERLDWDQYRRRVLSSTQYAEPPRPKIVLPIRAGPTRDFEEPVAIVELETPDRVATRWDFVIVYARTQIEAYDPTTAEPLWPAPIVCPMKPRLLGTTTDTAIFATDFQVFAVDIKTGQARWHVGAYPRDLGNVIRDPEVHKKESFVGLGLLPDTVIVARNRGEVSCIDVTTGKLRWRVELGGPLIGPVVGSEELVVCRGAEGKTHLFFILDAEALGKRLQTLQLESDEPSAWFDLSPNGTLVVATAQSIRAFEPFSGRPLWNERHGRPNLTASLALALDGVYICEDGQHLNKRDLSDGRVLWTSPGLHPASARPMSLTFSTALHRGDLYVRSVRAVTTLDPHSGNLAWEGTTERGARLDHHFIADAYVVAVDARKVERREGQRAGRQKQLSAYFYDRRDRSGIIPETHGVADLGTFDDIKSVILRDHALIIQNRQKLHFFTDKTIPAPTTKPTPPPAKPPPHANLQGEKGDEAEPTDDSD